MFEWEKNQRQSFLFYFYSLLFGGLFFTTDFIRANNNKNPIFSIYPDGYEDGGSKKYIGLFYIVYSLHYENPQKWMKNGLMKMVH